MSTTWNPQSGEQRMPQRAALAPEATPAPQSSATGAPPAPRVHSTWNATVRTMLGAALAVTLVLLAFAWPTYTSKVNDTPIALVAGDAQAGALRQKIQDSGAGFEVNSYGTRAEAVQAIKERKVYGGIVVDGAKTEVLTASAGSPAVSQMLAGFAQKSAASQMQAAGAARQQSAAALAELGAKAAAAQSSAQTLQAVAAQNPAAAPSLQPQIQAAQQQAGQLKAQLDAQKAALAKAPTPTMTVTDVVPLSSHDSRGAGFTIAGLPLAMGGMIGGVMIATLLVGWKRRLAAVAGYGVLGGLGLALVLNLWFKFIPGNFAMIWLVTGLAIAATASFIVGAQSLLGKAGIALGAVLTMFVGNPISSLASPHEWLPGAWGAIGQWFVPGAAGNLMRSEAYFPDAPTTQSWIALLCWFVVGVVLTMVGRHKDDEVVHMEGFVEAEKA